MRDCFVIRRTGISGRPATVHHFGGQEHQVLRRRVFRYEPYDRAQVHTKPRDLDTRAGATGKLKSPTRALNPVSSAQACCAMHLVLFVLLSCDRERRCWTYVVFVLLLKGLPWLDFPAYMSSSFGRRETILSCCCTAVPADKQRAALVPSSYPTTPHSPHVKSLLVEVLVTNAPPLAI